MAVARRVGVEDAPSGSRVERLGHVDCPVGDDAPKGRDLAGPGRSLVSMVLTLKAYRRHTPGRNRRISTIPAGRTDVGPVNVSAVDTGPCGSESGVLAARSGAPVTGPPHRLLPAVCAEGREAMTRRRSRFESRLELACSTRVGIYWPRGVRTARRPHLPKVHPTLVQ